MRGSFGVADQACGRKWTLRVYPPTLLPFAMWNMNGKCEREEWKKKEDEAEGSREAFAAVSLFLSPWPKHKSKGPRKSRAFYFSLSFLTLYLWERRLTEIHTTVLKSCLMSYCIAALVPTWFRDGIFGEDLTNKQRMRKLFSSPPYCRGSSFWRHLNAMDHSLGLSICGCACVCARVRKKFSFSVSSIRWRERSSSSFLSDLFWFIFLSPPKPPTHARTRFHYTNDDGRSLLLFHLERRPVYFERGREKAVKSFGYENSALSRSVAQPHIKMKTWKGFPLFSPARTLARVLPVSTRTQSL